MGAVLQEKQYELDGRVVFGLGADIEVFDDGWTPGGVNLDDQDAKLASRNGTRFGKTRRRGETWAFRLFTNAEEEVAGWESLRALAAVWKNPAYADETGVYVPLRYRLAGEDRIVFGQPRRWTPAPTNLSLGGRIDIVADFLTVDDIVYSDSLYSLPVTIAPPLDPDAGLIVPFIAPFTSTSGSADREFTVTIGGDRPTPIVARFEAPQGLADARVQVPGVFDVRLLDPIAAGDTVTVDARPWVTAATRANGAGVALSPRITRLSQMWLPPGSHQVVFTGTDTTSSASVTLEWRDAFSSPR